MFEKKKVRIYYIDWLRILLILSVFLFHIGMVFNTANWTIKNEEQIVWLGPIMRFLHLWRMPLLFLVSGVGTYFAIGYRTSMEYFKERTVRILLPFLAGLFTLIPIQVYIEKINLYDSLYEFYRHLFDGIYPLGNFSLRHHLWFLSYLFIISLIILPFLNFFRSNKYKALRARLLDISSKKLGLNWIIIVLLITQYITHQLFPDKSGVIFINWVKFFYYFFFFLIGLVLISNDKLVAKIEQQKKLYLIQTILFSLFLISIKYIFTDPVISDFLQEITKTIVTLSICVTALGYARKYLNKDSKYRKEMNDAIYPFYLLQQPIIVIVGYFIIQWNLPVASKILLLLVLSFSLIIIIYWFIIRPFSILRVIFGLKPYKRKSNNIWTFHRITKFRKNLFGLKPLKNKLSADK